MFESCVFLYFRAAITAIDCPEITPSISIKYGCCPRSRGFFCMLQSKWVWRNKKENKYGRDDVLARFGPQFTMWLDSELASAVNKLHFYQPLLYLLGGSEAGDLPLSSAYLYLYP